MNNELIERIEQFEGLAEVKKINGLWNTLQCVKVALTQQEEEIYRLEGLLDVDPYLSADAYDSACDQLEAWHRKRAGKGLPPLCEGSLVDGLSSILHRIDMLEERSQKQEAEAVAWRNKKECHRLISELRERVSVESESDYEPLYLHPPKPAAQTDGWDAEAYKSACDGLEHWRARAEAAEQALERIKDDLGPTHMGEPVLPQWSGWACQYPGKLPRLYGAREIAGANCDRENGDTLIYLQSSAAKEEGK